MPQQHCHSHSNAAQTETNKHCLCWAYDRTCQNSIQAACMPVLCLFTRTIDSYWGLQEGKVQLSSIQEQLTTLLINMGNGRHLTHPTPVHASHLSANPNQSNLVIPDNHTAPVLLSLFTTQLHRIKGKACCTCAATI